MPDLPGAAPETPSRTQNITDAEKTVLYKKAVKTLYGEKKPVAFKSKGLSLSGLKDISEWRNSEEVKKMGEGATLVQGLEADKYKRPETPEPAPTKPEDEKPEIPEPAPLPPEEVIVPPPLKTQESLALVNDPTRHEQQVGTLAKHDRSREKPARRFVSSLTTPLIHTGEFTRNVVQNTFLSGAFDARSMSFIRSIEQIARQHAGIDASIPYQLPFEIIDSAVAEGRKLRGGDKWYTRLGHTVADMGTGLTALYQNSDMVYAERWFKEHGKALVDESKSLSLREQTSFAERFTLGKEGTSKEKGEVVFTLDEAIPKQEVRDGLQVKIKELLGLYTQKQINDEELLKRFNQYYHEQIYPNIDPAKQRFFNNDLNNASKGKAIEISSNILRFAKEMLIEDRIAKDTVKTRYQRYQDEKAEDGQTMWSKLHFDIFLGRGKYETAVGETRLSGLEKDLIHLMEKRDYKTDDKRTRAAIELAKDSLIYAGVYAAGSFGLGRLITPVGGGVAGIIGMTAAREGALVSRKGKLYGWRGKSVADYEQVTRETAIGRQSMDKAKLRPMFEKAMVDQRSATELTHPIFELLQKDKLTPEEQKQLTQSIAHAKARLDLTDLSTHKGRSVTLDRLFSGFEVGEISVAHNFVGFNEPTRNAEMTALRAAIVNGSVRLSQENPELFGKLQQVQKVYESQLMIGSLENKLGAVVARELGISLPDADDLVKTFYEDLGIDNKSRKSLFKAANTLAIVVDKKAATTAIFAAAVSPIIGAEIHLLGEGLHLTREAIAGNLDGWTAEWGQILQGDIPLTVKNNGQVGTDLSALQKNVLWIHNLVAPVGLTIHNETIDGVTLALPGNIKHVEVAGNSDADAFINTRTGEVIFDLHNSHFTVENGQLMIKNDNTGTMIDAVSALDKAGIKLSPDSGLTQTTSTSETLFSPGASHEQELLVGGKSIVINTPDNAKWEFDRVTQKWDLIAFKPDGAPVFKPDGSRLVLIDNAEINPDGQIITTNAIINPNVQVNTVDTGTATSEIQLKNGAEIVDYLKQTTDAITTIAHRDVMKEQHALTTFVDSDGKIHITQGGYTAPNIISGSQSSSGAIEQGNGVLFFTFGTNAERANLSHEGIMVHLTPHTKGDGVYGEYIFDPNNPGTDSTAQTLASLVDKEALAQLAAKRPGDWLRESDLADLWLGVRGYEGGFVSTDPDGGLRMHDFEMEFAHGPGENTLTIPETTTTSITSIDIGEITDKTTVTNFGFKLDYDSKLDNPPFLFVPVPMRQNIEKSIKGKAATPSPSVSQSVVSTSASTTTPAVEEENKERKILEELSKMEEDEKPKIPETKTEGPKTIEEKSTSPEAIEVEFSRKLQELARFRLVMKTNNIPDNPEDDLKINRIIEEIQILQSNLGLTKSSREEILTYIDQQLPVPRIKLEDIKFGEEKVGTVQGAHRIKDENGNSFDAEVYKDDKDRLFLRSIRPGSKLKLIAENGTLHSIKADIGQVIGPRDFFLDGETIYMFDRGVFRRFLTSKEEEVVRRKIRKD